MVTKQDLDNDNANVDWGISQSSSLDEELQAINDLWDREDQPLPGMRSNLK